MKNKRVELLSPAGSYDSMRAAVNAGCDAVYIGGKMFGARAYADNPDEDGIIRCIEFCHVRGRKLYMTVNTLFKDDELKNGLYPFLKPYSDAGLDAVIVQDHGAMRFISDNFPMLPIHVSTQAAILMAEGANELSKKYNVTRVVPARELSLCELKRMREGTNLEMEVFIHGALCYSYSGNCLMSSMIGGRSGNRGRCAQPCRKQYEADGKSGYLLSPKDMCAVDILPDLIEAGVDSFKIEGRMKSPEYTAGVTGVYRELIDLYYSAGADEYRKYVKKHPEFIEDKKKLLRELYNRGGFCQGYFSSHNGADMMSVKRPNHSGVRVGRVMASDRRTADILTEEVLKPQDVIEIREEEKAVYEFTLGKEVNTGECLRTNIKPGSAVRRGQGVFRIRNEALLRSISGEYIEKDKKVKISGSFFAKSGDAIVLTLYSGDGCSVSVTGDCAEAAQKSAATPEGIRKQLSKLGDTDFVLEELEIQLTGDVFIPVSSLNNIRRSAAECLKAEILANAAGKAKEELKELKKHIKHNTEDTVNDVCEADDSYGQNELCDKKRILTVSVWNTEQLKAVSRYDDIDIVCYNLADTDVAKANEVCDIAKRYGKQLYFGLPYICRADTYDKLERFILAVGERSGYYYRNEEEQELLGRLLPLHKRVRSDYNVYVTNSVAAKENTAELFTLSPELTEAEIRKLAKECGERAELVIYGYQPVMYSAQCVYKNTHGGCRADKSGNTLLKLNDEYGHGFMVRQLCNFCFNIIYNADCLNITENANTKENGMPRHQRMDFAFESGAEIDAILGSLLRGERFTQKRSYTKGHFGRGVQ